MKTLTIFVLMAVVGSTGHASEWKNLKRICIKSSNGLHGAQNACEDLLKAVNLLGTEEVMFRAQCRRSAFADSCPGDQMAPMPVSFVLETSLIVIE